MKKIISMSLILFCSISLSACASNSKKSTNEAVNNKNEKVMRNKDGVTNQKFDQIKVGSISDGKGGTNKTDVFKYLGNTKNKKRSDLIGTNKKADQYRWDNINSSFKAKAVAVTFVDNKAVGKAYLANRDSIKNVVSNKKVDDIKTGANYYEVLDQFGKPAGESVSGTGKDSGKSATYFTNKNGKTVSFIFIDNKLVSKK